MLKTLLIDKTEVSLAALEQTIYLYCPNVQIEGKVNCIADAQKIIRNRSLDLLFIGEDFSDKELDEFFFNPLLFNFESIAVTNSKSKILSLVKYNISGYLLKPFQKQDFISTLQHAQRRVLLKEEYKKNALRLERGNSPDAKNELIGIPTLEGFDFVKITDIIRCQGMQKCTIIFIKPKIKLVSSYNLGEFRKILEPFGFFSPHKSHLINLQEIQKYRKDGTILMADNINVPVARRRRTDFLEVVCHV